MFTAISTKKLTGIVAVAALFCAGSVMAATVWEGGATDDIWDDTKWSNGLPTSSGNVGTIGGNAQWGVSQLTLSNYYLSVTNGTLKNSAESGSLRLSGGEQTLEGGSMDVPCPSNQWFYLQDGAVLTVKHPDSTFTTRHLRCSSTLILNDGKINLSGDMYLTGTFTMDGGTVTVAGNFGEVKTWSTGGNAFLNGGTLTASRLGFQKPFAVRLGGTTAGTATFSNGFSLVSGDRQYINIDWLPGSQMALTIGEADWASNEWAAGRMTYDGQDKDDLGDWSAVNGNIFVWDGDTNTLSLIPEPSTLLLLGLAGLMMMRRRRI